MSENAFERDNSFYAHERGDPETAVAVVVGKDGSMMISVTDEQAVDSYNRSFTCTCKLTQPQVAMLMAFLRKRLAAQADGGQPA